MSSSPDVAASALDDAGPAPVGPHHPEATTGRTGFLVGLALGVPLMVVGFRQVLTRVRGLPRPLDIGRWVIGTLVVHDGLWLPVAVAIGWVTSRFVPAAARVPVRVGLAMSAAITVATLPVTRRYGAIPDNPSVDPGNAGRALVVVLAMVWTVVAVTVALRLQRARHDVQTLRR